MRAIVYIAVASLFVHAVNAVESKQLNLALETILRFDKKDRSEDLAVIKKVQDFLQQIKNAMQGNARRSNRDDRDISFTDFVLQAAKTLKRLEDTDLEEVYIIIHDASRRYINKERDLQELFGNSDMRRFISGQLDKIKDVPAGDLRRYLDSAINLIEHVQKTGKNNDILDIGNTLYDGAGVKLRRALVNLENIFSKKGDTFNLENVLRTTLDSLVFNHYIDLGKEIRNKIVNMFQHYWQEISQGDYNAKVKNKNPVRVTPFRHERKSKHGLKNKKKSSEDDTKNISEKQEIFLSGSQLKKLIHNDNEDNKQKKKRFHAVRNKSKASPRHKGIINKSNNGKDKKITERSDSNESEEKYVMGGQVTRGFGFRGQKSSNENSFEQDKKEDIITSTEEIVIQHSNIIDVGLSRKIPGRLNITFVSAENDNDFTLRSSANDKISDKTKIIRKNIINDTLEDANPENSADVKKMIRNLEEQLEAVKDQIAYIKSFTQTQSKRSDNIDVFSNKTDNVTDAEGMRPMSFTFRAQYDTDSPKPRSQNNTSINTLNTFSNTTDIDTKTANERNKIKTEKNSDNKQVNYENSKSKNETHGDNSTSYQKDVSNKATSQSNVTKEIFNSTAANLVES